MGVICTVEENALGRPYCNLSVVKQAYEKDGERLFTRACNNRTRKNCFKLTACKLRLYKWKKILTMRVVKHEHIGLFKEVVDVPSLKVFKYWLDRTLSNLS